MRHCTCFFCLHGSSLSGFVVWQPNSCKVNTPHHVDDYYIDWLCIIVSWICSNFHTWSPWKTSCRATANHCKPIPLQHFWVSLLYLDNIPLQWWRPSEHGLGEIWTQKLEGDLLVRDILHLDNLIKTHFEYLASKIRRWTFGYMICHTISTISGHFGLLRFPPELGRHGRCCMPWRSSMS